MQPSVSIVIPTYNYAQYIQEAVKSVLNQNYPTEKIEIVVIDDGSTDNTQEILQPYINAGKVRYFYQDNKGKANATFRAIQEAKGEYIFNLDADDYFLENKIARFIHVFEQFPEVVHVGNVARIESTGPDNQTVEGIPIDLLDHPIVGHVLLSYFYNHCMLFGGGSTFAAKASVLKSISAPSEVDMYIDEYLILAVLNCGASYLISEPLSVWRVHERNYSVGKLSFEERKKKYERLLKSSDAILHQIRSEFYPTEIKNLYHLQHTIRMLYFKEELGGKTWKDIFSFFLFFFASGKYTYRQLKSYSAFNRLLPTFFLHLLRKWKTRQPGNND